MKIILVFLWFNLDAFIVAKTLFLHGLPNPPAYILITSVEELNFINVTNLMTFW